jgi:hypothetical protein
MRTSVVLSYTFFCTVKSQKFLHEHSHAHQVKRITSYLVSPPHTSAQNLPAALDLSYLTSTLDQGVIVQDDNQCSHGGISTLKGVPKVGS